MRLGRVPQAHKLPPGAPHFLRKRRARAKHADLGGELADIAGGIKQSGLAIANEFAPRAKIGSYDGAPGCIRLENGLAQRFVGAGRQHGELRLRDQRVTLGGINMSYEVHVGQTQRRSQVLQGLALRTIAGDDQPHLRNLLHGTQEVVDALFGRQPAEVEYGRIVGWARQFVRVLKTNILKVRQDLEFVAVPSMLDELVAHKMARREEQVHTLPVGTEPAMNVGLGGQGDAGAHSRITGGLQGMPECASLAGLARFAARNQVVTRAKQLEIVQVIEDGYVLGLEFPQN